MAFGGVGVVVARRQPHNPLGWILLGCLFVLALGGIAGFYAVLVYRLGHHGLPLAPVAVVLGNSVQLQALLAVPLIILLFPDGQLPGPRWRWVLRAYAGFGACVLALTAAPPIAAVAAVATSASTLPAISPLQVICRAGLTGSARLSSPPGSRGSCCWACAARC
ncbi:MAG: hypothetical protein ACRDOB_13055 [Streptosporangiaceae bacterium]